MRLTLHRRIAAKVLKCSPKRVRFDPAQLEDAKEAITKSDVRILSGQGGVSSIEARGVSRVRARHQAKQRRKGLRKGAGNRKGTPNARSPAKRAWIRKVRTQRSFLQELKEKDVLVPGVFRGLYGKVKGNFFRSRRHIKLYIDENNLVKKR